MLRALAFDKCRRVCYPTYCRRFPPNLWIRYEFAFSAKSTGSPSIEPENRKYNVRDI